MQLANRSILSNLNILRGNWYLLKTWTLRDIRIRYKQSFLGAAWAILQPLALMVIFTVVFSKFVQVDTGDIPYPIFSYTALLPWTFFTNSITFGTSSLVSNLNLVTKVYLPREIMPLSSIGAAFVDFLIASIVYLGLMLFFRWPLSITMILVPLLIGIQVLLMAGIVLITSAVNVFYRDVRFVIPLVLQLWLYASPIIYPLEAVPEQYRMLYMLNPMAGLIHSYRAVILEGVWPDWRYLGIAFVLSSATFLLGYRYFKRIEWEFADVI